MLIYKDTFTGDELFTDAYKCVLVEDVVYEVYGKHISRVEDDIQLAGANPSAEEADEGTDTATQSGIDVVLNQQLKDCYAFSDKKSYMGYIKDYFKKLVKKIEEREPDKVDALKASLNKVAKDLIGKFKDLSFYTGESMDIEGMVIALEYREVDGGEIPILHFFKHGLDEEKY